MNGLELKEALHAGRRVYGTAVLSNSPFWPNMLAGTGLDFVFIDTEHVPIDRHPLAWMCRTYAALNLAPIVRVPEPNPYLACMALDAGAAGVIFPYVERPEQVQELRGAVKLRPLKGERLQAALRDDSSLDPEVVRYLGDRNADKLLIVNIESQPALDRLDAILAVPGVDALLVGPHDLSINLGVPEQWDHPVFQEAIARIIRTAREHHVGVGIHFSWKIEPEIEWAKLGANFIVHSSDVSLVQAKLTEDLARFRAELGDEAAATGGGDTVV